MKKNIYKQILRLLALSLIVVGLSSGSVHAAGSGTISLSPSSASVDKDKTVTIVIQAASDEEYNTVQVDLSYDQAALEYVGMDGAGSAFDSPLPSNGGGGSVQVVRGSTVGLTGSKKVVSVNFKALAGSGSSSVSVVGSSLILRSSDSQNVWNGSVSSSALSFVTPSTPTTPAKIVPKKTTPAPVIADDVPVPVAAATTTEGYLVAIQVFDYNKKGVEGVVVDMDGKKVTTDAYGIASFTNVQAGEHTVKALGVTKKIVVAEGDGTATQSFTVTQGEIGKKTSKILWIALSLGGLLDRKSVV